MPTEMHARHDVFIDEYDRKVRLEGKVALEIARGMIEPAVAHELKSLAQTLNAMRDAGLDAGTGSLRETARGLGDWLDRLHAACAALEARLGGVTADIQSAMAEVRMAADTLETLVDDARWPLPKYRDMLAIH